MANSKKSKVKLIKLYEILRTETDSNHRLTTNELVEKIRALGIACDRRTLSSDINNLNSIGLPVKMKKQGYQNAYYVDDSAFSVPELKILIDAVQAANFITEEKSSELIEKLSVLGGTYRQEVLEGNRITFNTRKHSNENILRNVEIINAAINEHKKISFYYFDLNENHERVFRKNKKRYKENPAALVYNEDNYYLICYSDKYKKQLNYRVDRMEMIMKLSEDIPKESYALVAALPEYTKQVFKMFGGEPEDITLEFDDSLIGSIYDKFGEEIKIERISDDRCRTTVSVQVSPTFWGWLAQFGNRLTVVKPEGVKEEISQVVKELESVYC
jgi:predicted DNA-binding transcriptional regulator YafY